MFTELTSEMFVDTFSAFCKLNVYEKFIQCAPSFKGTVWSDKDRLKVVNIGYLATCFYNFKFNLNSSLYYYESADTVTMPKKDFFKHNPDNFQKPSPAVVQLHLRTNGGGP
jgi:hypothetical protein